MSDFPTFQYSYFIANGAQLVIRNDDYSEFLNDVKRVQEDFLPTTGSTSQFASKNVSNQIVGASTDVQCPIHHKELKDKIAKSGKPYKAHFKKVGDEWDICFGKGWQSEKQGQSSTQIAQKLNDKNEEVLPDDVPF